MQCIIKALQDRVELLHKANKIEQLSKGYSNDKKYIIYGNNHKFLLRVAEKESYERKEAEFQLLKEMQRLNVQSPEPIAKGKFDELNSCYTLYSYIEGTDAKEALEILSDEEQYGIGYEAGKELSIMHLLKSPSTIKPWYERVMEKHYRYLKAYKS
ncbi:aminoglycoside phosphotransferase family protein [Metabacillus halosaccharovorans]|uniref:aminoglycoside phosphotransferase family protein n=1 Tax=Metabacillus halosaccharovorans TaxID=930124 RepID=UPI0015E0C171|nr:aminoglycoside phosphotransferase family protein [Metabacillus halosaccharovorans]MCM3444187.1 aminoglycoside phosphotransferase family protein [Metabacillus halosaccharovorans]